MTRNRTVLNAVIAVPSFQLMISSGGQYLIQSALLYFFYFIFLVLIIIKKTKEKKEEKGPFIVVVKASCAFFPTTVVHKRSSDRVFLSRLFLSVINNPGSGSRSVVIALRGFSRTQTFGGMIKRATYAIG